MDVIQQVLGDQYAMFYHDSIGSDQLVRYQTTEQYINSVNQALKAHGKNLSSWPNWLQNRIAKLVRAHVIYHRLSVEPIRKPILIHQEQDKFIVDCGDTRLMVANQLPSPIPMSVILTCRISAVAQYQNWTRIHNLAELATCTGFALDSDSVKLTLAPDSADHALSWLEFGDQTTAHHLHDPQQRLDMMQKYLDQQTDDFRFDDTWLLKEIKWY